jgi:hypothetical protein
VQTRSRARGRCEHRVGMVRMVRMVRMMRMVVVSVRMVRMMRMVAVRWRLCCRPSSTIVAVSAQGTGAVLSSGATVIAIAIRGPVARVCAVGVGRVAVRSVAVRNVAVRNVAVRSVAVRWRLCCRPSATIVAVGAQGTGAVPGSGAAVVAFAIPGPVARV